MDPPWADAPRFEYRLFRVPLKMARSYRSLMANMKKFLLSKSDEQVGGTKYVRHREIPVGEGQPKTYVHELPELPRKHDYFIVVMIPPPDLEDGDREVDLLFSANSMYYLGYSSEVLWKVFDDAHLVGVAKADEPMYSISRLDFPGSYLGIGTDFEKLTIGFNGQIETYRTLVNKWASKQELIRASCRNVVGISESTRFPFLRKLHLTNFQLGYFGALLDAPVRKGEEYRKMSEHFNVWSNYSGKCQKGEEKFAEEITEKPILGIPTFDCLLNFVAVLSNKDHGNPNKVDQSEKSNNQDVSSQDDDKKGGGDKGPSNEKDENGQEKQKKISSSSIWFFEAPVMPYASGRWICRCIKQEADEIDVLEEDESPCIFGPIVKQTWSYACATQRIERLIYSEGAENDFKSTIVRPFDWIGPRMDFIPDVDGPCEGVPRVLAYFCNNFLRRESLKLVDSGGSQQTLVYIKDAIEAALLMIVKYCSENNRCLIHFSTSEVYRKTIGSFLPNENPVCKVMYCSENDKSLIHFSTCEVNSKTIGSFHPKDHPFCKDAEFYVLIGDESPCIFGPIVEQTWSYACATQLIKMLIFAEGAENDLGFTIVRAFILIGPRMDFMPDGVPQVLACFCNDLLRREPLKFVDGGESQRTSVCMKDDIEAVILIIENPARGNGHILNVGNTSKVIVRELAEMMTEVCANFSGQRPLEDPLTGMCEKQFQCKGYDDSDQVCANFSGQRPLEDPLIGVCEKQFRCKGYDDSDQVIPDMTLTNKQLGWNPKSPLKYFLEMTLTYQHKTYI